MWCSIADSGAWQRYEVFTDPYHGVLRLNLYRFDGSPMNPMYLAFKPPQMLPTETMNPTTSATAGAQPTGKTKIKRGHQEVTVPLNKHVIKPRRESIDADRWWWIGVGMTTLGGFAYLAF